MQGLAVGGLEIDAVGVEEAEGSDVPQRVAQRFSNRHIDGGRSRFFLRLQEGLDPARVDGAAGGVDGDFQSLRERVQGTRTENGRHSELSRDRCQMARDATLLCDHRGGQPEKGGPSRQRLFEDQDRPFRAGQGVAVAVHPVNRPRGRSGTRVDPADDQWRRRARRRWTVSGGKRLGERTALEDDHLAIGRGRPFHVDRRLEVVLEAKSHFGNSDRFLVT